MSLPDIPSTIARFFIHNIEWFVPRFLYAFIDWINLKPPAFDASLETYLLQLTAIKLSAGVHRAILKYSQHTELARAAKLLFMEAVTIADRRVAIRGGTSNEALHQLSDESSKGLLATIELRREAFPSYTPANQIASKSYHMLEVAICGLLSCLQETFLTEWQQIHSGELAGLTLQQTMSKIEDLVGLEHFEAMRLHFQSQGEESATFRDTIYEMASQSMDEKNSGAVLTTFKVVGYAAALNHALQIGDIRSLQVALEFFAEQCEPQILLKLPLQTIQALLTIATEGLGQEEDAQAGPSQKGYNSLSRFIVCNRARSILSKLQQSAQAGEPQERPAPQEELKLPVSSPRDLSNSHESNDAPSPSDLGADGKSSEPQTSGPSGPDHTPPTEAPLDVTELSQSVECLTIHPPTAQNNKKKKKKRR